MSDMIIDNNSQISELFSKVKRLHSSEYNYDKKLHDKANSIYNDDTLTLEEIDKAIEDYRNKYEGDDDPDSDDFTGIEI